MIETINKVIRKIDDDPAREWTVREMAEIAGVSPNYFSNLFKRVVVVHGPDMQKIHLTPKAYVKWARMSAAATQLSDGAFVGYPDDTCDRLRRRGEEGLVGSVD